jgi:hypothetical protein
VDPTRSDLALIRQLARRQDWEVSPDRKARIIATLCDLIDPPTDESTGQPRKVAPRTRLAAAKTLAAFGQLALRQQQIDHAQDPPLPDDDARRALWEVEQLIQERKREQLPPGQE